MRRTHLGAWALGLVLAASPALAPQTLARAHDAIASRSDAATLLVDWHASGPVDVYLATRHDAPLASARPVARAVRSGHAKVRAAATPRPYVLLRDRSDGRVTTVAERMLPLAQGSNFRDLGGYPAADGKTVRWGLIYRSGATPLLSPADIAMVRGLGLTTMVDLRSDEERRLAPTRLAGHIHQDAVPYSMMALFAGNHGKVTGNGGALYRQFPTLLAPQVRLVFDRLKAHAGPIEYNCSAGQDRTGFMTALILSALGTPRAVILQDYDLSTALRRPEWEMPRIDAATAASDPVARLFAGYQANPAMARPQPLHDPDGRTFLASALDEIDTRYGSVEGYLDKVAGVGAADIAALRKAYTE